MASLGENHASNPFDDPRVSLKPSTINFTYQSVTNKEKQMVDDRWVHPVAPSQQSRTFCVFFPYPTQRHVRVHRFFVSIPRTTTLYSQARHCPCVPLPLPRPIKRSYGSSPTTTPSIPFDPSQLAVVLSILITRGEARRGEGSKSKMEMSCFESLLQEIRNHIIRGTIINRHH